MPLTPHTASSQGHVCSNSVGHSNKEFLKFLPASLKQQERAMTKCTAEHAMFTLMYVALLSM